MKWIHGSDGTPSRERIFLHLLMRSMPHQELLSSKTARFAFTTCRCGDYLPAGDTLRTEVLDAFQAHMTTLPAHQDTTGMWHQVIDVPASYREVSATCLIAAPCGAAFARAWYAIRSRISCEGELVDVCAGTGKQDSLKAYLARPALLGMDARAGPWRC